MNKNKLINNCKSINLILNLDNSNKNILNNYDLNIINNFDYKTYKYIDYDYIKIYLIACDILKRQYIKLEHNIKKLIINYNNNYNYNNNDTSDEEFYINDFIKFNNNELKELNDKILIKINKINNNIFYKGIEDDKYKYELFNNYFNCSIIDYLNNIKNNKNNLNELNNIIHKLLMFYLNKIYIEYDETYNECDILKIITTCHNIIFSLLRSKIY